MLGSADACLMHVGRGLVDLRRSAGAYSSSFAIEDVELVFDDGTVVELVLKDLGPHSMLPEAARVKPAFLFDPRREIETYRHVLGPYEVGAPAMVAAAVEEGAQSYLLLLKKVGGVPLWQRGDVEAWHAAARWLAALHVRLARDAAALASPARLLRYDEAYFSRWYDRARSTLTSGAHNADALRLLRAYEAAIPRILRLPATFIHGEYHSSNILVEPLAAGVKITPVDWEMAALGPGLMDLADLTAGNWTSEQRDALARTYREELARAGAPVSTDFTRKLDDCRLHRAMQWISWSTDWSPPREHAQDWFAEGLRLSQCLGEALA
jgi:hypothetical protein